jgi:hypothetical protein
MADIILDRGFGFVTVFLAEGGMAGEMGVNQMNYWRSVLVILSDCRKWGAPTAVSSGGLQMRVRAVKVR